MGYHSDYLSQISIIVATKFLLCLFLYYIYFSFLSLSLLSIFGIFSSLSVIAGTLFVNFSIFTFWFIVQLISKTIKICYDFISLVFQTRFRLFSQHDFIAFIIAFSAIAHSSSYLRSSLRRFRYRNQCGFSANDQKSHRINWSSFWSWVETVRRTGPTITMVLYTFCKYVIFPPSVPFSKHRETCANNGA